MTALSQTVPEPEHDPLDDPQDADHRPFPDPEHSIAPRKPRTIGGVVFLLVLAGTLGGLAVVVLGPWRLGLAGTGVVLLVGALARLVIPEEDAGMLGVRRKVVDVVTLTILGTALVVLAAVIPPPPAP